MKSAKLVVVILCASLVLSACARSSKSTSNVSTTTTGQELTDLKAAYDAGAMSEDEYEKKRQQILKKKG